MNRIYLDHAATTPLLPEAAEAMQPWLDHEFGNASSLHHEGRKAKEAIDLARETFSEALGCLFGEIVFTSSGTEAANLALVGTALANPNPSRNRILLGAAEHHCVLHTKPLLEKLGYKVDLIPVTASAQITPQAVQNLLAEDVLLVSVMHANNEFGTINPVEEIAPLAKAAGALVHIDAVQTFPDAWTVDSFPADLINVSAHKFNGPKGVGALYIRAGTEVKPLAYGGGQEREMRAGTENVAALVGAATALRHHLRNPQSRKAVAPLRDAFETALAPLAPHVVFSVEPGIPRLPGHSHFRVPGIDAEIALIRLDRAGISASSGAACSSGSLEPSHVLQATGLTEKQSREGLRFTFAPTNTPHQAQQAAHQVQQTLTSILQAKSR